MQTYYCFHASFNEPTCFIGLPEPPALLPLSSSARGLRRALFFRLWDRLPCPAACAQHSLRVCLRERHGPDGTGPKFPVSPGPDRTKETSIAWIREGKSSAKGSHHRSEPSGQATSRTPNASLPHKLKFDRPYSGHGHPVQTGIQKVRPA